MNDQKINEGHLDLDIDYRIDGFELSVKQALPAQGITAIFGPSGSGKTTLLSLIAGFAHPARGHIRFGGQGWFDKPAKKSVPAHKRPVGFLFQHSHLFPHLSVKGNLDYAERRSAEACSGYGFDDIIKATDIGDLLQRSPANLSGGEQKRVALARTLLTRPRLLLFDEPLTGLDTRRKIQLLPLLERAAREFSIPCLYVSHDINEVARLADHVLILKSGRAAAFGPAETTLAAYGLEAGRNPYERVSVLTGRAADKADADSGLMKIEIEGSPFWLPARTDLSPGDPVRLAVSPRDVTLSLTQPAGLSIQNILPAEVTTINAQLASAFCDVDLALGQQRLRARITQRAAKSLALTPGQNLYALIKSAAFQT